MRITHALLLLSLTALFSCSSDEDATTATELEPTTVNVTFTGLNISVTPDLKANAPLRASATQSGVTRIAFKVLDATGKEVYSEDKKYGSDNDFDHVVCPLHVGKYTFVAVAHKAKNLDSPVATVTSTDKALLTESYVPKLVYAKTMDVTVAGNTTQNVTMDFDKRITSSFRLKVLDAYPDEVTKVRLTADASKPKAKSPFAFSPATGFAPSALSYTNTISRAENNLSSFTGKEIGLHFFLTKDEQQMDIVIDMLNDNDEVLYTRTLSNLTLSPQGDTRHRYILHELYHYHLQLQHVRRYPHRRPFESLTGNHIPSRMTACEERYFGGEQNVSTNKSTFTTKKP